MRIDSSTAPERHSLLRLCGLFRVCYLWRLPWLILHALLGMLIAIFIMSLNPNQVVRDGREPFANRLIRYWSGGLLRIFGMCVVRSGQPHADPVMFVANHTSWLDIGLLHSQRAACFVGKAEIARWPLIGVLATSGGTLFHQRGSARSLTNVMRTMVRHLRTGRSVAVFPEGSTSYNGVPKAFHARLFQVALDAGTMVQPVALSFSRQGKRVIEAGFYKDESFMSNLFRLLGSVPMHAEIHFLEPIAPQARARRHIAGLARERITMALKDHYS